MLKIVTNETQYIQIDSIRVVSVFITENAAVYEPLEVDTFQNAAIDVIVGRMDS